MLSSTTVLNIDDNMKYFFNSKSAYCNDHVTLKTRVMTDETSTLHHRIKLHFTIFLNRRVLLKCNNISQYYRFYCIFDQINAALVRLLSKALKSLFFSLKFFFHWISWFCFTLKCIILCNRTCWKWQHVFIKWIMYRLSLVSVLSWSLESELQNSPTYNSRKMLCFLIFPQYWFQTIHCALFTVNNSHGPFSVINFILHMNVIVCLMFFFSPNTDSILVGYLFLVLHKSHAAIMPP